MTLFALLSSIVISTVSFAWGFAQRGFTSFSIWMLILGVVWFLAVWQKWRWYSSFALIVSIVISAFGLWFGFVPGWMFAGVIFAIFAWDMTDFLQRLSLISNDKDLLGIERRHLARVSLLALIGLVIANITMLLTGAAFTLEWGVLLLVVTLLGLGQLIGWFRK